ncbi:MAG: hypothetical protein B9S32_14920 [Verrucomicrobia bacterium Tous-C9LFEB]|nr:MAG: hypothetical protein B9S32_14920 [Verrucomicrobia bacterium Tous-C9LFEB]
MTSRTSTFRHDSNLHVDSLSPVRVNHRPGATYAASTRLWQGIPGVECTAAGTLFATWYSGGKGEGPDNYVLLQRSRDEGKTWSEPLLVIDPPDKVRAFDPALWIDPLKRFWLIWSQSFLWYNGRAGVWFIRCDQPDAEKLEWTEPQRIGNGVMMNKPLVTTTGEWLFPIAVWKTVDPKLPELQQEALSSVFASVDEGRSFTRRGGSDVPLRTFDEHMLVEQRDHRLWMWVRTQYGIGQSHSTDGGVTWSEGTPTAIAGPDARFHVRRLPNGRLLLINHYRFTKRSHLTASLSEDDGLTWTSHLLLDERAEVSYPDATVTPDGAIHVIYDRERHKAREILLARFTEDEVLAGAITHSESYLKRIVSQAIAPLPPTTG